MATKGRPAITVRLSDEEIALIEKTVDELNRKQFATPYTVAAFVRSCIAERLAKIKRGRKRPRAAGTAAVAVPTRAGTDDETDSAAERGNT